jgi:hypothetical protein
MEDITVTTGPSRDNQGTKRRPRPRRLVVSALVAGTLFLLSQVPRTGWAGGACVRWVTGPDPEAYPVYEWKAFGYPWEFLRVTEEGCDNRTTATVFKPEALAGNAMAFAVVGGCLYAVLAAFRKGRKGLSIGGR